VLTAVDLDEDVPITASEVDVIATNRLLADEFVATELPVPVSTM
jgi:hypothetical protein